MNQQCYVFLYSSHKLKLARLVIWNDLRVKWCEGPAANSWWGAFSFTLSLFCYHCGSEVVVQSLGFWDCSVYLRSPSPLLHRSSLCNAGCCASSLWSVLLILPRPALHLLWHVQTHIRRWEIHTKFLVEALPLVLKSPPTICGWCPHGDSIKTTRQQKGTRRTPWDLKLPFFVITLCPCVYCSTRYRHMPNVCQIWQQGLLTHFAIDVPKPRPLNYWCCACQGLFLFSHGTYTVHSENGSRFSTWNSS